MHFFILFGEVFGDCLSLRVSTPLKTKFSLPITYRYPIAAPILLMQRLPIIQRKGLEAKQKIILRL